MPADLGPPDEMCPFLNQSLPPPGLLDGPYQQG